MKLVNKWFQTGKFIKVDTPFCTYYTYKKEPVAALPLTGNALHEAEMEYHGKFGHTLGSIQHIALMSIIQFCPLLVIYQPKMWHLLFLVSKVSSAVFNTWLVSHITPSFILLVIIINS